MKVKIKKLSNAPQIYGYTAYVPKSDIPFAPSARVCSPETDFMEVYRNRECIRKYNYQHLAAGQLYGKRANVLSHIVRLHLLPPGGVISLVSHTNDEISHWIITANPAGLLRVPRFGKE